MALTEIFLMVATLLLAARKTWFPAVTCRITSRSDPPLPLLGRIMSCSLPSSANRASPSPLIAAEMKIQPSRGGVQENVSPALVGAAAMSSVVRLLSLWGWGWAGVESGQAVTKAPAKMVKGVQRVGRRRQRRAVRGG